MRMFRSLVLSVVTIAVAHQSFAQTTGTTGALTGKVDSDGVALPGVTIVLSGVALQGTRVAVTGEDGLYVMPLLPTGRYDAVYALDGFGEAKRSDVLISVRQSTNLNISLSMVASETLSVRASQVVIDTTEVTARHTLLADQLKYGSVGSQNRNYQAVVQQAAGVAGGRNPQVSGANMAQNDWLLDGMSITNPVSHTFGVNLPFDAIQQVSVETFGKDAEHRSSGGTIDVVTKSGGNSLAGSIGWNYSDPGFLGAGTKTVSESPEYYGAPDTGQALLRFDKSLQTERSSQPEATIGGAIAADRLWFFASTHHTDLSRRPAALFGFTPNALTRKGLDSLGKLTGTPAVNQTLTLQFLDSRATINNIDESSLYRPEANSRQIQQTGGLALSYDAVLKANWLVNSRLNRRSTTIEFMPMSGDLHTPSIFDVTTGITSQNGGWHQKGTDDVDELVASATHYIDRSGTHVLKAGLSVVRAKFNSFSHAIGDPSLVSGFDPAWCGPQLGFPEGTQCGVSILTNDGAPYLLQISPTTPAHAASSETRTFFVQDEWHPTPRLTARIGVRDDRVEFHANGREIPSFHLVQPRLGVAFDVFDNANSVIHGYAGKLLDDSQLFLPYNASKELGGVAILAHNGKKYRPVYSSISLYGTDVDPNLKPTYSLQYSAGWTQRVGRNTSIDVTAQYRTMRNMFDDYCGTDEEPLESCVITNEPAGINDILRSTYQAVVTTIETRPTDRLSASFSWTHSKSLSSTAGDDFAEALNVGMTVDLYPSGFRNIYGYTTDDATDRLKLNGFYRLPLDFTLGMAWYWDSGKAWSVTHTDEAAGGRAVFLEPRGSRRLPHFHQLDLQLQKDITVRRVRLGLIGSIYNVLSSETGTAITGDAGVEAITGPDGKLFIDADQQNGAHRLSPMFGRYSDFQKPRSYEVAVRLVF